MFNTRTDSCNFVLKLANLSSKATQQTFSKTSQMSNSWHVGISADFVMLLHTKYLMTTPEFFIYFVKLPVN